jgi:hypothetical protein
MTESTKEARRRGKDDEARVKKMATLCDFSVNKLNSSTTLQLLRGHIIEKQ